MSDDDHVSRIVRELRESAEHQRFRERLESRTMRVLSPFYGTWLRPSTVKKRRCHVRTSRLAWLLCLLLVMWLVLLLLVYCR